MNGDSIQYSYGSTATYKPIEYPAYTPTPTQQIPATSTPSTPIQQTQQAPVYTPPPAVIVPTVSFTNLTTGNAAVLNIGDRWRISVTGPAGSQVVVTGGQGGRRDVTSMGTTDAAGRWTLEGTITADQVGQWSESWTVGGATAGAYSFTVPAPATNTSNTTGTNNQTGSTPANTGDTTTDLVGGGTSTDQAGGSTEVVGGSIIDQIISALPVSVQPTAQWIHDELSGMPGWGWIAVAAWILWFMNSRKGKR